MALQLLTDEQITGAVAEQVRAHRPGVDIQSIHTWRDGALRGEPDARLLAEAASEGLTLVTYDQKTIPPLLQEWVALGRGHAGVVFVDGRSLPSNQVGSLVMALISLWDGSADWDWTDRVVFLRPVSPS